MRNKRWFWDYIIPTEANDFQPHFLRLRATAALLALVILFEGVFLAHTFIVLPHTNLFGAIFATVLIDETNESRIHENLRNLTPNPILEKAAQLKADDMASKGYFAHNAPDGKTPWYWFEEAGYDYAAAGENLAVNFTDSKDVTNAWLASPAHRANIMNANYTEIGIASAKGIYKGKEAIFVVQEFGRPSLIALQAIPASTIASTTKDVSLIGNADTQVISMKPAPAVRMNIRSTSSTSTLINTGSSSISNTITTATSAIAGASKEKLSVAPSLAPINSPVLEHRAPTLIEQLIASPRQISNYIYLIIAALLTFILGLTIFIKIRVQHPHIIANGILLIAVIISLVFLNGALGFTQAIG